MVKKIQRIAAAFLPPICVGAIDLFLPHNLGFPSSAFLPYLVAAVFAVYFVDLWHGIASAATSAALVVGVLPLLDRLFDLPATPVSGIETLEARIITAIVAILAYRIAVDHHRDRTTARVSRDDLLSQRRENYRMATQLSALEKTLRTLYDRSITQSTSISVLYEQLGRMYSFNRRVVFTTVLESTEYLSGATSSALYMFDDESLQLELQDHRGVGTQPEPPANLDTATSVEGWVVRNNRMFTLRMRLHNPDLERFAESRTVIAVPVHAHGRVWGVLSVNDLPMRKYNEFAEKAVLLVAALAGPALERAVASVFDGGEAKEAAHEIRPRERLLPFLDQATRRAAEANHNLNLFLFELRDADGIVAQVGMSGLQELISEIASILSALSDATAAIFEYNEPHQFCAAVSTLDYDAASYFLLRMIESISSRAWTAEGELLLPEVIVGFASTAQTGFDARELIQKSEHVLSLQRVSTELEHGGR